MNVLASSFSQKATRSRCGSPKASSAARRAHETKSVRSATPPELSTVANDARVFGSLAEGQRVRYEPDPGHFAEGTLIEKCRFGGLVLLEDGTLVGVGFRRIWPTKRMCDAEN